MNFNQTATMHPKPSLQLGHVSPFSNTPPRPQQQFFPHTRMMTPSPLLPPGPRAQQQVFHSSWQQQQRTPSANTIIPQSPQPVPYYRPPTPILYPPRPRVGVDITGNKAPPLMGPVYGVLPYQLPSISSEPPDPFISDWLRRVGERRSKVTEQRETKKGIKIPEIRSLLSRSDSLIKSLRALHASLTAVPKDDVTTWRSLMSQVHQYRAELESLQIQLNEPSLIEHFVRKVGRISARRKRSRLNRRAREAAQKEKMVEAEEKTDNWLRERREKELRQKTEQSVQASAKKQLEDVHKKQADVKQLSLLLVALNALRDHRKETRKKGDVLPPDTEEVYKDRHDTLEGLLSERVSEYEKEEHTLRVLMSEEVNEKMSTQSVLTVAVPTVCATPVGGHPTHTYPYIMSGPPAEGPPTHTYPHMLGPPTEVPLTHTYQNIVPGPPAEGPPAYSQYWLQAQFGEECKAAIRHSWSCYEHPEGTPLSTHITPPAECSQAWEQFIAQE